MAATQKRAKTRFQQALPEQTQVVLPERAKFEIDLSNPMHVHQHALDVTGEALLNNDFDTFAQFFALPHEIETFASRVSVRSRNDLRTVFENSRRQNEESGATHRVRHCISACFKDENTLLCAHMSRIMNGNYQLRDAVPCHSTFERFDGVWLLTRSAYAIEETDRPYDRLLSRHGAPLALPQV